MIYYIVYFLTKLVSLVYFPRVIYGHEHIPIAGGFVLACNHVSNLDPVVMGISAKRRINFMAKIELFRKQPLGFILTKLGAFAVKRGVVDFGALKEAVKRLNKGQPVLMFIEGTRRIGDALPKAQPGAGFLAVKAKVPVIPVYMDGTQNVMPPRRKFLVRNTVTVRFGPPVNVDPREPYQTIADGILRDIYRLKNISGS